MASRTRSQSGLSSPVDPKPFATLRQPLDAVGRKVKPSVLGTLRVCVCVCWGGGGSKSVNADVSL